VILSGLYRLCAVSDFLRHTQLYNRKVGVSWSLFLVLLRIASNVSNALQYDVTTSITSGLFLLLNVLYVRYRRELFINKSVLFFLIIFKNHNQNDVFRTISGYGIDI